MVLTAGHCICSFYDFETDGLRSTRNCKPNPENPSLKNIGKQFNHQTPNNDKIPKNHISMKESLCSNGHCLVTLKTNLHYYKS